MQSKAPTVTEYLKSLEPERRKEIQAVRTVIKKHLPKGYVEIMDFGMISYVVPLSVFPDTYNGHPLGVAALAAQKNYNSVYLMTVYGDKKSEKWFHDAYHKSGKKLDMGKSCVRFKRADDLPLDVIGQAVGRLSVEEFLAMYQKARAGTTRKR